MTKEQEKHVQTFGEKRFHKVLVAAAITTSADSRFTGAGKIRREISEQAALEASGFPRKPFVLSKHCGSVTEQIETAAQEVFARAYEAACEIARAPA
jgi:hypothetical protein